MFAMSAHACLGGVVLSLLLTLSHGLPATSKKPKVILVSMDGFRHDYLTKGNTPNFEDMLSAGVTMPYVNNTFVTLTFPSHYSIATGTYEETHGIVANNMYDPVYNETFGMGTTDPKWWNGSEPIWTTAKKAGLKVGVYFWPGSSSPFNGLLPDEWRDYNDSVEYEHRVRTVVSWMSRDDFDLALLYFDEPDHSGHALGPDNPQLVPVIERMDCILGLLVSELTTAGIVDDVNLIVTSDHGMASVDTKTRLIDVLDYVNDTVFLKMYQQGPAAQMRPQEGKAAELKEALKDVRHMKVMLKEEIPEEKHYKNHRRVLPVFALAENGWQITANATRRLNWPFKGDHGFDDDLLTMRPIFVARGPAFKTNETVEPIKNVDIYPLICHLLGIEPSPNNGSLERAMTLLRTRGNPKDPGDGSSSLTAATTTIWVLASLCFVFSFVQI